MQDRHASHHVLQDRNNGRRANIDAETFIDMYEEQDGKCYYMQIPLNLGDGDWMISLERLDESQGYQRDNVRLVAIEANVSVGTMQAAQQIRWSEELVAKLWPARE